VAAAAAALAAAVADICHLLTVLKQSQKNAHLLPLLQQELHRYKTSATAAIPTWPLLELLLKNRQKMVV
jgi:hypothetical protein